MIIPGERVESLCKGARHEVLLVAPFAKAEIIERLFATIDLSVSIRCITRWRPDEILSGVSDLEVWDILKRRAHSSLWLRHDLHAKYYRIDNSCLVGSANLTAAGLGWAAASNLELLIPVEERTDQLAEFEGNLISGSVPVNDAIYDAMKKCVETLIASGFTIENIITKELVAEETSPYNRPNIESWIPTLRHPEQLYNIYADKTEHLTKVGIECGRQDLSVFELPKALNKEAFKTAIGALLLQMPVINKVDNFLEKPQRFGAVADLLRTLPCAMIHEFDAKIAWQTLMRWLICFLSGRYRYGVPKWSEIFERISAVSV